MTDRDDVLRKIRALLQKTVANGCPMEEALAAHAKARKLIDEYQVSHERLYVTGPGQQQRAEPEPEHAAEATEQAYAHNANDPDFRSSMTARLANALYWTFSGLAVLLLSFEKRSTVFLVEDCHRLVVFGGQSQSTSVRQN